MRLLTGTMIVLVAAHIRLFAGGDLLPHGSNPVESPRGAIQAGRASGTGVAAVDQSLSSEQFTALIYYGLNGSHSRSWVQTDDEGVIGMSVFQRFAGSPDEGALTYNTISPDGPRNMEIVTTGRRLEKSVLLYDDANRPHIFVATSDTTDQIVSRFTRDDGGQWNCDTLVHFYNQGGKFIYELSADKGPDGSFYILLLITRSDIDSEDFWWAWQGCRIYLLSNVGGSWAAEHIRHYDMPYTADHYIKTSSRQDMKVDANGYVHIVIGEQVAEATRLLYLNNEYGSWQTEIAFDYDPLTRDDAGWFPSLCLDNTGVPHISCMYIHRYPAGSAIYSRLFLVRRVGPGNWVSQVVADTDDGYYGNDGGGFTGGMSHLVFDHNNTPHIVFSDIASSHWDGINHLNAGNIRYAVYQDGAWHITTVYRQPLPDAFYDATEMHGMCLAMSPVTDTIRVIGQELNIYDFGADQYTCRLVAFDWQRTPTSVEESTGYAPPSLPLVSPIFPNPFNAIATIRFSLPSRTKVTATIYDLLGRRVTTLFDSELGAGDHSLYWRGNDYHGEPVSSGVYFCRFRTGDHVETKRVILVK